MTFHTVIRSGSAFLCQLPPPPPSKPTPMSIILEPQRDQQSKSGIFVFISTNPPLQPPQIELDTASLMGRVSVWLSLCDPGEQSHHVRFLSSGPGTAKAEYGGINSVPNCIYWPFLAPPNPGLWWCINSCDWLFTRHLLACVNVTRQIPPITLITPLPGLSHCQERGRWRHERRRVSLRYREIWYSRRERGGVGVGSYSGVVYQSSKQIFVHNCPEIPVHHL